MTEVVSVFHTRSEVEASIVRGLLESHGIPSVVASHLPPSIFPMAVNPLGETVVSVHPDDAEEARRLIDSHRTEFTTGQLVRLRDEFQALQQAIGYRFRDLGLLERAMTHTSRANEDASGGVVHNESMEFLGDAILGFVVADLLFRDFPDFDEGQKSKAKAALVSTPTLARQSERLRLGDQLLLGRGEEKTGGRRKEALLADSYEALIAAVYLDGGIERACDFVRREFQPLLADVRLHGLGGRDFKSALQEWLQSGNQPPPEYRLVGASGPDHRKQFHVEVVVAGRAMGDGTGTSKKEAEQEAARVTLERVRQPE